MLSKVDGYYSGVQSINGYSDADIKCEDIDGDGYYNWGIGPKPAHCPNCPAQQDADDFNPYVGGMNKYGYGVNLYSPSMVFPLLVGPDTITCDGTYQLINLNMNITNITWQVVDNSQPSYYGNKLIQTTTQDCPMATFVQGKSYLNNRPYTGSATIKVSMYNVSTKQTKVLEKQVYVAGSNTPYLNTTLLTTVTNKNDTRTFTALNCEQTLANNIAWTIKTPSQHVVNYRGRSISYKFAEVGTYYFEVKNLASCDPNNLFTFSIPVMDEVIVMSHNNPVDHELNVSIKDDVKQNDDQYTIEIWHDQFGKMKSMTSPSKNININTEELGLGYYTIKLYKNNICVQSSRVLIK